MFHPASQMQAAREREEMPNAGGARQQWKTAAGLNTAKKTIHAWPQRRGVSEDRGSQVQPSSLRLPVICRLLSGGRSVHKGETGRTDFEDGLGELAQFADP